jgi:uncharacterized membrane protein HdeD (DUF308 family)
MKEGIQKNWNLLMFNGLIALFYGILAIFASEAVILTIVIYLGILILVTGFAMLYGVYSNYKNHLAYGFDLFQSIVVLLLGILLTFYSQQSLQVFVIIIGSWAIMMGAVQLYYAFNLHGKNNSKTSLIANGILTLVFGTMLLFNPFEIANFVVILSGIMALLAGIMLIVLSLKLKNFRANINLND